MITELELRIKRVFDKYNHNEQWDDLVEDYRSVSQAIHKLELEDLITREEYIILDDYIEECFEEAADRLD